MGSALRNPPAAMPAWATASLSGPADRWVPLAIGDFNGDGKTEILWQDSTSLHVKVQTSPGKQRALERIVGQTDKTVACVGDFNGDGRDEVLWRPATNITAAPEMWFFDTDARLTSTSAVSRTLDFSVYSISPNAGKRTGDTNGGGKADVVIRGNGVVSDYVWCMNGASVVAEAVDGTGALRVTPTEWRMMLLDDFGNSGRTGIIWRNFITGENYWYPLTGSTIDSATEGLTRTIADFAWTMIGSGEFDNASGRDILWRNLTSSEGYIYPMNGKTITANEGYCSGFSAFDAYTLIGVGDFSGTGQRNACLWWNSTTRVAKIAIITLVGSGGAGQFAIAAGTEVS